MELVRIYGFEKQLLPPKGKKFPNWEHSPNKACLPVLTLACRLKNRHLPSGCFFNKSGALAHKTCFILKTWCLLHKNRLLFIKR
jgi:hypothetical protein